MAIGCTHCKEKFTDEDTAKLHVVQHAVVHDKYDPLVGMVPAVKEVPDEEEEAP